MSEDFTPEPWVAEDLDREGVFPHVRIGPVLPYVDHSGYNDDFIVVNCGPSPEMVKKGFGGGSTMKTTRANARLIAAAPKLFKVCVEVAAVEKICRIFPDKIPADILGTLLALGEIARAALDEARGVKK